MSRDTLFFTYTDSLSSLPPTLREKLEYFLVDIILNCNGNFRGLSQSGIKRVANDLMREVSHVVLGFNKGEILCVGRLKRHEHSLIILDFLFKEADYDTLLLRSLIKYIDYAAYKEGLGGSIEVCLPDILTSLSMQDSLTNFKAEGYAVESKTGSHITLSKPTGVHYVG